MVAGGIPVADATPAEIINIKTATEEAFMLGPHDSITWTTRRRLGINGRRRLADLSYIVTFTRARRLIYFLTPQCNFKKRRE